MTRTATLLATLVGSVALAGCAPFVPQVDLTHISPEVRAASNSIRIYEAGGAPPKVTKTLGDVDAYSCKHLMTDPPASRGNALQQLRVKALQMGANAVLDVVFDTRGTDTFGTNCWETVHAAGIAVVAEQ